MKGRNGSNSDVTCVAAPQGSPRRNAMRRRLAGGCWAAPGAGALHRGRAQTPPVTIGKRGSVAAEEPFGHAAEHDATDHESRRQRRPSSCTQRHDADAIRKRNAREDKDVWPMT
jgi:hypothetical protein